MVVHVHDYTMVFRLSSALRRALSKTNGVSDWTRGMPLAPEPLPEPMRFAVRAAAAL